MSMLGESSINMWSKNDCRLEFHCECECSVLLQQMVGVNLPIWVYLTVYDGLHLAQGFCPGEVFPLVVGHKVSRAGHSNPFGRPTNLQVLASVIPMFNLSCQLVNRSPSVIRPVWSNSCCSTLYYFILLHKWKCLSCKGSTDVSMDVLYTPNSKLVPSYFNKNYLLSTWD